MKTKKYLHPTLLGSAALVVAGLFCFASIPQSTPPSEIVHGDTPTASNDISHSPSVSAARTNTVDSNTVQARQLSQSGLNASPSRQITSVQADSATPTFTTSTGEVFPLRTYKTLAVNDPYATDWWIDSTGMNQAWDIGAGSYQTVVAVIDSGFGLQHEELINRWEMNGGEQGATTSQGISQYNCTDQALPLDASCNLIDDEFDGIVDNEVGPTTIENPSRLNCTDQGTPLDKSCNMLDDDNNGYVDDATGWDFANYDANVQAGEVNPAGDGTQHGTEVAGVLAATGNNSRGIAGVNWATKILPLQALDDDSYGNTLTVARAIYYAADRGVDVISISLGADSEDPYLRQAVQYAIDAGAIVVAASGNDGCDCISYPARYPEVLAVGAQNPSGTRSTFSNYGSALDVTAPGESMTTTTWTKANPASSYASGVAGTSFATPYVSGLLSLARSHHPDASWGELMNTLLATASHTGLTASSPTSPLVGAGYANAERLMNRATSPTSQGMRYLFGPIAQSGTLGGTLVRQCSETGDFPTAPLYEITSGVSTSYTIDTLEYVRAIDSGKAAKRLWFSCVGLPGDLPSTTRTINLHSEIRNNPSYKPPV